MDRGDQHGPGRRAITYDSVPPGDVQVRRGDHVHATDGEIGLVEGLVIDPGDHQVTHVLLQEGHLWGRKEVAIPIRAVTGMKLGVQLNLTRQQVGTCRRWTLITRAGRPARIRRDTSSSLAVSHPGPGSRG